MKNNIFKIFAFSLLSTICINSFSQHTNIEITKINSPEETSIYINPKNTNEMIVGANLASLNFSTDGGHTWINKQISSTLGVWGDPVVIIDTIGNYYYFHLSNPSNGSWIDRIVCQKSTDKGETWNDGVGIGLNGIKAQDKPWAVVNPYNNDIYVTWTQFDDYGSSDPNCKTEIMFSKSSNMGLTWTDAKKINIISGDCIDDDNTVEGAVPAVGPNGEIYVSWAGPNGLVFNKSTDGGNTWLDEEIKVSDIPGGWTFDIDGIMRSNGLPITCCDLSNGPNKGTIYINWTDQRNGPFDTDVWLVKSKDGGNTWSNPIRVNNDSTNTHQFFTWMTIDKTNGNLWFIYYDRSKYTNTLTDVCVAVSKDGGETFNSSTISKSPFLPNKQIFFGDYNGIAAYNDIVRPVWTRLHQNALSIHTAIINTQFIDNQNVGEDIYNESTISPNPVNESTFLSFKVIKPSFVTVDIYDIRGNKILNIFENKKYPQGKHVEEINFNKTNLPKGTYFIQMYIDNKKSKTQKIILN